jgi:hypothetical protein
VHEYLMSRAVMVLLVGFALAYEFGALYICSTRTLTTGLWLEEEVGKIMAEGSVEQHIL